MSAVARTGDAFAPRQITATRPRMAVLLSCVAVLVLVSVVEIAVPNNPTLGGFLLLAALMLRDDLVLAPFQRMVEFSDDVHLA